MKINLKVSFLFLAFFPHLTWANEAESIPVQGICEELRKGASWTVIQYFNGVTKDEQYINIDRVLPIEESPDENKIYKGFTDTVYQNIPFVQNIDQRNWYEDQFSDGIYKLCIEKYTNLKH